MRAPALWSAAGVGLLLVAVLVPLSWLFTRNNPEEQGLEVDGNSVDLTPRLSDLSLGSALSSPSFWAFALSSSVFGLVYSGISLFNQSILEQRGFDATTYHAVLVVSTLLGLLANFGGGWLASRWPIQRLMGIGMTVLAAAVLGLPLVRTYTQVMLYGVGMGVSGGVVTVVLDIRKASGPGSPVPVRVDIFDSRSGKVSPFWRGLAARGGRLRSHAATSSGASQVESLIADRSAGGG